MPHEPGFPRPVLCAIDASPPSGAALRVASEVSVALGAPLELVHVWARFGVGMSEARARRFVADAGRSVSADQCHFATDGVVNGILDVAESTGARMIVIGTHARGLWGRFFLGSTAHDLLHRITVPLLIVRPDALWPPERIIVGADASEAARAATELAAEIATAYGASVTLVEAVPAARAIPVTQDPRGALASELVHTAADHLEGYAKSFEVAGRPRPKVSVRVVQAKEALIQSTGRDRPALVVVGRRDAGVHRDPTVSVSEELLHGTDAPLLVYPSAALEGADT